MNCHHSSFWPSTGGGWYMLGAQSFSVVCLLLWGLIITYPILWIVNSIIPIRLEPQDEILGCDLVEHFMGEEKERMLDGVQISNLKLGGSQVNFNMAPTFYPTTNSYREFNTLPIRRSNVHSNAVFDPSEIEPQRSNSKL
jgi:hypothetical protein